MNWPEWVFNELTTDAPFIAKIPIGRIKSPGSLEGKLPCPFAVIRFGTELPRIGNATGHELTVWIHDDPGSYDLINECLTLAKTALVAGPIAVAGAMSCAWEGNSADLADDSYGTLTKYASFQLVGRN